MHTRNSLLFLFLAGTLCGCIHSYYVPSSHNVPLLTEKKEARVSANFYWTSRDFFNTVPGFELQGSYALTNHLGVMGNFLTAGKSFDSVSFDAKYGDVGIGYFTTTADRRFVFELYGGYGLGSTQNRFEGNTFTASDYSKVFIQPAVGFKSPYFDIAFSWRFGSINHSSLRLYGTLMTNGIDEFNVVLNKPVYTVSEPAITLRGGTEMLKLQIQGGWSEIHNTGSTSRMFGSASLILMLPIRRSE